MKQNELNDMLILMGGIAFLAGVFVKITGQELLFLPVAYWRFAIGCLAVSIALSLHRIAKR